MTTAAPERTDSGKASGLGVVTKWEPAALARKELIVETLTGRGLVGAELEAEALARAKTMGLDWDEAHSFNTLVNGGTNYMVSALTANPGTLYNNANAALGVGDSSAAFALTQTNLQGTTNNTDRIRVAMNATYPSVAANVLTAQSTFATGQANFTWNEWAFFNNVTDGSGTMLNRSVANLGTKTSASAWQLTVTITQN